MLPESVVHQFKLPYDDFSIQPISSGLINDTLLISSKKTPENERFVLQKINKTVFNQPDKLMNNLIRINRHLEIKAAAHQQLIPSKKGLLYFVDDNSDYWRVTKYLENTRTLFSTDDPEIAYEAATNYGKFLHDLHDLNPAEICETIANFHNYKNRIVQLTDAIKSNVADRLRYAENERDIVHNKLHLIERYYNLNMPIRVIHGDTKITNILFDAHSYKGKLVIDLDISMPASILYDYGDMVRSFTNTLEEDNPALDLIDVKRDIFEHLTRGFLQSTSSFATETEKANLLLGAKLVILIQAIRNLTDYLKGDVYYKIDYDRHNLHRAQNQLTFLSAVEKRETELQKMIDKHTR